MVYDVALRQAAAQPLVQTIRSLLAGLPSDRTLLLLLYQQLFAILPYYPAGLHCALTRAGIRVQEAVSAHQYPLAHHWLQEMLTTLLRLDSPGGPGPDVLASNTEVLLLRARECLRLPL